MSKRFLQKKIQPSQSRVSDSAMTTLLPQGSTCLAFKLRGKLHVWFWSGAKASHQSSTGTVPYQKRAFAMIGVVDRTVLKVRSLESEDLAVRPPIGISYARSSSSREPSSSTISLQIFVLRYLASRSLKQSLFNSWSIGRPLLVNPHLS